MQLPPDLLKAIETALAGISQRDLTESVHDLSRRYRESHSSPDVPLLQSQADVAAYLAYRLPATYAAISAAMRETRACQPDLSPRVLLDIGGGPGTAAWAAINTWTSIEEVTVIERDPRVIHIGKALAAQASSPVIRAMHWHEANVLEPWVTDPADITVAAYMLGEIPDVSRAPFLQQFWEHTRETGIIIEPGTPPGWGIVREAGDRLSKLGADIVAPFPWTWQCVENDRDWCHFSERVPRSRLHRISKEADLGYEDEKYTYISASRQPGTPIAARVIRHPQIRKGHVRLVLCTPEGVVHHVVAHSDREAFRRAKRLTWGSAVPVLDESS